jgi:HAD superfamily hydrolase (TIGR01509 family)
MQFLHLEYGIDGIISGDDVERPKPYPDCFLKAMELEGVLPSETIIFEDSAVGIEAARLSGAAYSIISME